MSGIALVAGAAWIVALLAAPRQSGGITLPGMFHESRWDIFLDPEVWTFIGTGVVATLQAAAVAAVGAIALGVVFSLMRSSRLPWVRIPTAVMLERYSIVKRA